MIDWPAFVIVLAAALVGAAVVVSAYALGLRLLTVSGGRTPIVTPAEFTDAITIVTPAQIKAAEKRAAKAAKKNPLTAGAEAPRLRRRVGVFRDVGPRGPLRHLPHRAVPAQGGVRHPRIEEACARMPVIATVVA